jgi:hypothetical protein
MGDLLGEVYVGESIVVTDLAGRPTSVSPSLRRLHHPKQCHGLRHRLGCPL